MRLSALSFLAVLAAGAPAHAAPAAPAIDPRCFSNVGWEVNPDSEVIRAFGCRPAPQIPAPGKDGWVTHQRVKAKDGTDRGWIRARIVSVADDGTWVFDVQYNGGGSGTFPYRVTGKPGPDGVIPKLGRKIDALPAN